MRGRMKMALRRFVALVDRHCTDCRSPTCPLPCEEGLQMRLRNVGLFYDGRDEEP